MEEGEVDLVDDTGGDYEEEQNLSEETSTLEVSPSMTMDYRVLWIRNKVLKFLGLDAKHKILFDNLINDNHRYFEDKLLNFLVLDVYGVSDLEKKQVFFYKTYRSEVVQEEVEVWEESERSKNEN